MELIDFWFLHIHTFQQVIQHPAKAILRILTITIEDTNERFLLLVYLKNTLIKNIKGMNFNSSSPIIEKKSETRLIIFRFKGVSSTGNKLNISKAEAIAIEYTIYMTNINTARIISFFVGL